MRLVARTPGVGSLARASAVVAIGVIPAFMTGALAVQMRLEFDLTPTTLGLLVGLFFGCAALASGPGGHMVQRIGARRGMRLTSLGAALCLAGIALFGHSAAEMAAFLVIGGLANGLAHPSANLHLLGSVPMHRRGLALGIKQAAIPAATLFAGASVPLFALTVGWRWAFVAAAIVALLIMPLRRSDKRPSVTDTAVPGESIPLISRHTHHNVLLLAVGAMLGIWGGQAMAAFLVIYAVERGLGDAGAGMVLTIASVAGIGARVAVGWIVDRRRGTGIGELTLMLGIGAAGLLLIASGVTALIWIGPLIAFAGGWGWTGLLNLVAVRASPNAPAIATGIVQSGVFLGAMLGVPLFGALAQQTSFQAAWVATAATAVIAMAIMSIVGRRLVDTPPLGGTDAA